MTGLYECLCVCVADLMKLGGLEVCVSRCVCHTEAGVRWRAAELLACCAQNMPEVQLYLLQQGALHTLLHLTDHDTHPTVRVKALYAVSCESLTHTHTYRHCMRFSYLDKILTLHLLTTGLVREQEVGLRDFLSHDGFSVLMRGMQSDCEKLRTKSAFLLLNLLTSHPDHRGVYVCMCVCFIMRMPSHSPLPLSQIQCCVWGWYSSW